MTEYSNNLCRVCLKQGGNMVSIYEYDDVSKYVDKINHCTQINITELDGYPTLICDGCQTELLIAYNFIVKCQDSDKYLRDSCVKVEVKEENQDEEDVGVSDHSLGEHREQGTDDIKERKLSTKHTIASKRKRKESYVKKIKVKKEMNTLQCAICGLVVASRSAMIIHARRHTGEKPFQCGTCGARFTQAGSLKVHELRRHPRGPSAARLRPFGCDLCSRFFFRKRDLEIHTRIHTGEVPHACGQCGRRFSQLGSLIRHRRIHTGERPFRCPDAHCGKAFADSSMLHQHRSVHTHEKGFSCPICGKAVKSQNTLKKHMSIHAEGKPVMCEQCGASFSTRGNLRSHTLRQHGPPSGQCGQCGRQCPDLQEHMRSHSGEASYTCHVCDKKFVLRRSLSLHMHKHNNSDKFACEEDGCQKTFPLRYLLDFHRLKFHSTETPHVCDICSKGFLRIGDLTRHNKIHHSRVIVQKERSVL